jgi:type II secretory pathway pseudopilin PulG
MKLMVSSPAAACRRRAFTLIDILIAIVVMSVLFVTLYMGFTQGFAVIQLARENLRATQILQEKMETIRLYNWDQVNTPGFIPATFTAPFYAVDNQTNDSLIYAGRVTVGNSTLSGVTYNDDLRTVTVELTWRSGNVDRRRQMRTFISQYGLQNYIY